MLTLNILLDTFDSAMEIDQVNAAAVEKECGYFVYQKRIYRSTWGRHDSRDPIPVASHDAVGDWFQQELKPWL